MMKCKTCLEEKSLDQFYVDKNGYRRKECKTCISEKKKNHYKKNKTETLSRNKKYRDNNRDKIALSKKKYLESSCPFDGWGEKLSPFENVIRSEDDSSLLCVQCTYCGLFFTPTVQEVLSRLKFYNGKNIITNSGKHRYHGESRFYCSDGCKANCLTFKKKKNISSNRLVTEVTPEFRKMVLNEDDYTCLYCGKSKHNDITLELHCHHILPKSIDPIQSCDLNNVITVCKECHKWIHTIIDGCKYWDICRRQ